MGFVLLFQHGADTDRAFLGELDGVADQVGQDLFQPQCITAQADGRIPINDADQFQVLLMGGWGEHGQRILNQIAEVERLIVENQFASLNFREIENLVDDRQQVVSGLFYGAQVLLLAIAQLGTLQQVAEADNAVQGCT